MGVKSYNDLIVWQKAMDLAESVYRASRTFPREELFGLTGQLRRAAVSVPSNIAEGQGRATTRDFLHFLAVARGSLNELETQLLLAHRLGYIDDEQWSTLVNLADEVGRLLRGLVHSLSRSNIG